MGNLVWVSPGIIVPLSLICRESHLQIACNKHGAKNVVETLAKLAEKVWSADIDCFLIAVVWRCLLGHQQGRASLNMFNDRVSHSTYLIPAEAVLCQVLKGATANCRSAKQVVHLQR